VSIRRGAAAALAALVLAGTAPADAGPVGATLVPRHFADLAGWATADTRAALAAFREVCAATAERQPASGLAAALRPPCAAARRLAAHPGERAARRFFEVEFRPVEVVPAGGRGFFTGYFEPEIAGALRPTARFSAPLLARPADLVVLAPAARLPGAAVPLTAARRLPDGSLAPYPDRAAIETGALGARARALAWVDPIDAFFVQVQGAGRIRLADGRVLSLAFAGRNGWPYTAIARVLVERGAMTRAEATAAALRAWLVAHPAAAPALMRENRSYIFFREDEARGARSGPLGAAHAPLHPRVSIAVDHRAWPYGLPVWIDAALAVGPGGALAPFRRLTIAADTGSAIVGPARADIFFGSGAAAGATAGLVKQHGRFVALLPRNAAP
jgi:membrane-bound lytic murein transglycosylase A